MIQFEKRRGEDNILVHDMGQGYSNVQHIKYGDIGV